MPTLGRRAPKIAWLKSSLLSAGMKTSDYGERIRGADA
jgi:hypothetical protein